MPQIDRTIPIQFDIKKSYEIEDTRFLEVTIKLMHLEENFNGSYFSKEVVKSAIPSLANTPILAYIEDNKNGDKDYSDHREILVKENGQYKIKYIGQAIGVIPETNNARFEIHKTASGKEREYLVVDGLLWTKFDDPIEIMQRDEKHQQSMELHKNYEGRFEDDNLFHFTYFQFFGACALSNIDILPAMEEASRELKYTLDDFKKEIQDKMEQFKQFSKNQLSNIDIDINKINTQEGGNKVVEDKIKLLEKYNLTVESLSFSIDELTLEEIESKIKAQFSLSNNQLMTEINKVLQSKVEVRENYWGELKEVRSFYLLDLKDSYAIVATYDWDTYFGIPYIVNGDIVTLDFESKVEFIPDWRQKQVGDNAFFTNVKEVITSEFKTVKEITETKVNDITEKFNTLETEKNDLQVKLEETTEKFTSLEAEVITLKEFQTQKLTTERKEAEEELFSKFNENLKGDESYETLKSTASEFTLEELESKCFAIYGKKTANFSINRKDTKSIKINVNKSPEGDEPYGGLLEKYLNK